MQQESLIKVSNLSKKYRGEWILKDISFELHRGISYVLLGHNGCGKSTLLRLLAGLTVSDKGKVEYASEKLKFAFVPDKMPILSISGRSYLRHMGEIDGIKKDILNDKIEKLANVFL